MAESESELIDRNFSELPDWQGEILSHARALIKQALPEVVEEIKWRKPSKPGGVPVWSHHGIICHGEGFKDKVKVSFAKGAALDDPVGLFNGSLGGNTMRAIDMYEGDGLDESAFKSLVQAAAALNESKTRS